MHSNPSAFTLVTRCWESIILPEGGGEAWSGHFGGVLRVERARCLSAPGVCIPAASVVPREFQTTDGCARAKLTRNDLPERRLGPVVDDGQQSPDYRERR